MFLRASGLVLAVLVSTAYGKTPCKTDRDCPSTYCMNDETKTPPYFCHGCGVGCCNSDAECPGSYCLNDATKLPPYTCHGAAPSTIPGQTGILRGIPTRKIAPGVEMPMQGLGTWQYNTSVTKEAVLSALSLGYVHIDTALIYGNQKGVGAALKESGLARKDYFITTKIPGGLNDTATREALDQDLAELQLDYVDLMLVHYPSTMDAAQTGGKAARQGMWKIMEKFVKAGKARAIGVSHYCSRHLADLMEIADKNIPIAVNQVQFHIGMGNAGANATDDKQFCDAHGILYESFSPLCGPCGTKELIDGPLVSQIGKKHGKSGAQVSLRWQVQQGIPVIPKTANPLHQKENLDLFSWSLTEEDMAALSKATSPPVAGAPGSPPTSGDCGIL